MEKSINSNKMDLSIIIVSYNTKQLLIDCIESIKKTAQKIKYEVIVVDNASSDGSMEALNEKYGNDKNVIGIENKENYGFSKANNIGIEKSSGRYVLFLNSDTVVYDKTLDGMVEFMDKTPDAGASTCYLIMPNGKMDDACHRGFPTPLRALSHFTGLSKVLPFSPLFAGYNLTYLDFSKTHEIEALAGAFMIVPREVGEKLGWWDEDYFFYGEDLDLCYRIKLLGLKIYFVPEYKILHYKGASGGLKKTSKNVSSASKQTRKRATDARFNAMKIFYNKHYQKKYPFFVTFLVFFGIRVKKFLTEIKQ